MILAFRAAGSTIFSSMKLRSFCLGAFALILLVLANSVHAIDAGQVDDFQDGTVRDWINGGGSPVLNIDTGGPTGAGDRYLQISSTGSIEPGGRLTVLNLIQWVGNYIAAGVTAIEIDLRNEGAVDLSIRLAFKESFGFGTPGYLSQPMILPAGSGWLHFSISLAPGNLIAVGDPAPYATFFSTGNGEMRIINAVGTSNLIGDPIAAQLGIDNIRAVPEPATTALLGTGMLLLAARLARGKRGSTRV